MSAACFGCARPVTGVAGVDPRIVVPLDEGDGKVGSLIYGKCCGQRVPRTASLLNAQAFLDFRSMMAKTRTAPRVPWSEAQVAFNARKAARKAGTR